MSNAREDSPDWLRSFQAPTLSVTTLSSDSELSGDKAPIKYERGEKQGDNVSNVAVQSDVNKSSNKKMAKKRVKVGDEMPAKRRKTEKRKKSGSEGEEEAKKEDGSDEPMEASARNHLIWALSSDSESDAEVSMSKNEAKENSSFQKSLELLNNKEKSVNAEMTPKVAMKRKSPKKRVNTEDVKLKEEKKTNDNVKIEGEGGIVDVPEEVIPEKHVEPRVTSSTLPLVLPEKVSRSKALVECEGESIDLSGDMGAVGRVIIAETPSKEPEMFLDLKGTIYKTTIVPSRTFCVVSIGQSEAKIEAIVNDFVQLAPQSNVYDAETMVEGTLDGFSFDSEDEVDKTTKDTKSDQTEGGEEKANAKSKGKAEKKLGATQKKGRAAGSKQPKKRKPQGPKKGKGKK